jgi:hypothetical protein
VMMMIEQQQQQQQQQQKFKKEILLPYKRFLLKRTTSLKRWNTSLLRIKRQLPNC